MYNMRRKESQRLMNIYYFHFIFQFQLAFISFAVDGLWIKLNLEISATEQLINKTLVWKCRSEGNKLPLENSLFKGNKGRTIEKVKATSIHWERGREERLR